VLKAEYDTNYPVETYDTRKQALSTAISLIQDYQKLREKIDVNKIGNIIRENLGTHKNFETWLIEKDNISQAIVTYLKQPTEH
jgi:hypothetical protein